MVWTTLLNRWKVTRTSVKDIPTSSTADPPFLHNMSSKLINLMTLPPPITPRPNTVMSNLQAPVLLPTTVSCLLVFFLMNYWLLDFNQIIYRKQVKWSKRDSLRDGNWRRPFNIQLLIFLPKLLSIMIIICLSGLI